MTGVPTQFAIADLVLQALREAGEAVPADADLPYYYLGAIGPALSDFLPARLDAPTDPSNAPLLGVWLPVLRLLAGTENQPGLVANLQTLKDVLQRVRDAVARRDKLALADMRTELEGVEALIERLRVQLDTVNDLREDVLRNVLRARSRPKVAPAAARHARDTLHGHATGTFWGELRHRAAESGDPRLQAFGLGATVGYAGALSGNPFINGVVGAPIRNHWWRHRWVSHSVDAWSWGYVRTRERVRAEGREVVFSNAGRVPVPPYAAWDDIAGAELQGRFALGGITADAVLAMVRDEAPAPPFLPDELVSLLLDCYRDAYGDPAPAGIDAAGVQGAYVMIWLQTWISSSASFLGATPPHRVNEPDGCGQRPDWVEVDGSVLVGGTLVPPPQVDPPTPSVPKLVSAVVLAILAILNFALLQVSAGVGKLIIAAALADSGTDPDWDGLRCHIGWIDQFVAQLDNHFRALLYATGLGPPYAAQLAHNEIFFQQWGDAVEPATAGLRTCRSPSDLEPRPPGRLDSDYPASTWLPVPNDGGAWTRYPGEPPEGPRQISYPRGPWWPLHFLDGFTFEDRGDQADPRFTATQVNPLEAPGGNPSVLSSEEWERRMQRAEGGGMPQMGFGNAVEVALALIRAPGEDLPHWDLDGDRGIGWPTWVWRDPAGAPGDVVRE